MHSLIISEIFCVKNLEYIDNEIFIKVEKNTKSFAEKSFIVLGGAPMNASKHTKTVFNQMFIYLIF